MTPQKKALIITIAETVLLALLYAYGMVEKLFFHIWWYDIPLHFLGGLAIAMAVLYVYYFAGLFAPVAAPRRFFLLALIAAIVVGIIWEIFEYVSGFTFTTGDKYVLDTLKDMGMDILGALVAYIYYMRHYNFFLTKEPNV